MTLFVVGFENRSSRRNTFSSYHWTVISYHWPRPILTKRKLLTMKRTEKDNQSFADQLEDRLINFAVRIIRLSARLPRTPAGKHVAGQILRSGTSPAPNYGEARGAESNADFILPKRWLHRGSVSRRWRPISLGGTNLRAPANLRNVQMAREGTVFTARRNVAWCFGRRCFDSWAFHKTVNRTPSVGPNNSFKPKPLRGSA